MWFSFLCVIPFVMIGCASPELAARSLSRQQSETLESLNNEILRLNQELDGMAGQQEGLQGIKLKAERMFSEQIDRGEVRVDLNPRGLVMMVLDHALFDPDKSQLTSSGEAILKKIASVLSSDLSENKVTLEGHTDNQPIEDASGITNWEYSVGRASAVLHYFIDVKTLAPERFRVVGYSEYRPIASNETEEGRALNRRVEIVIAPERGSDVPEHF